MTSKDCVAPRAAFECVVTFAATKMIALLVAADVVIQALQPINILDVVIGRNEATRSFALPAGSVIPRVLEVAAATTRYARLAAFAEANNLASHLSSYPMKKV